MKDMRCANCSYFNEAHEFCRAVIVREDEVRYFKPTSAILGDNCRNYKRCSKSRENIMTWLIGG